MKNWCCRWLTERGNLEEIYHRCENKWTVGALKPSFMNMGNKSENNNIVRYFNEFLSHFSKRISHEPRFYFSIVLSFVSHKPRSRELNASNERRPSLWVQGVNSHDDLIYVFWSFLELQLTTECRRDETILMIHRTNLMAFQFCCSHRFQSYHISTVLKKKHF